MIKLVINSFLLTCGFLILVSISASSVYGKTNIEKSQFLSNSEFQKIITDIPNIEPECDEINSDFSSNKWLKQVKFIKINLNEKKYFKNILIKAKEYRIARLSPGIINAQVGNQTSRKWSKYAKAEVQFNNSQCKFSAKFRLTGDLIDHMGRAGNIPHSIKIKLNDGRIGNITKFKLFVPKARTGKYEILNVLIHKKTGFIAPETAMVNVQIGGQIYQALFQEDISKELLETNNLHDGIIIEGDEGYEPLTNPRILNTKLITNENINRISRDLLDLISPVYLNTNKLSLVDTPHYNQVELTDHIIQEPWTQPALAIDFLPTNSQDRFVYFHLLNLALKNGPGLTLDDHRIAYDQISREMYPIYYDGHHNSIEKTQEKINFKFSEKHTKFLINQFKKLDVKELSSLLKDRGVRIENNEISNIINDAVIFLEKAHISINYKKRKKLLDEFSWTDYLKKAANLNGRKLKVSWKHNSDELKTCLINDDYLQCKLEKVDSSFFTEDYPFYPQNLNDGLFLHGFDEKAKNQPYFSLLQKNSVAIGDNGAVLEHTSNIKPIIDKSKKSIIIRRINRNNQTAQIKISGGILFNWSLVVEEDTNLGYISLEGNRASELGLTGCVTFNDIKLVNMTVKLGKSECEDAVHFVRSNGNLNSLIVLNAKSDAIDADFSQLIFEKLHVEYAGNDCLDLSSGLYFLQETNLSNCADKGLSAGEGAKVEIDNITLNDALYGIVSKDSSEIEVNFAAISGTKICLSAYRKKQEYGGGTIKAEKDIKCDGSPSFIQKNSRIY
jgi:hypothetical protein